MKKSKRYYIPDDLYYSTIYGGGVYRWDGQLVQDPLCGDRGEGFVSPLLENVITGEQFFMKRLDCSEELAHSYEQRILTPPMNDHLLWPSDMVKLTPVQQAACTLFVAQEYTPTPTPAAQRQGSYALLFPYGGYPKLEDGMKKLAQMDNPNWHDPRIRNMAVQIVKALETVNRNGYFYTDIHLSRIYFHEDGSVYLDFSNLIFSFRDSVGSQAGKGCHLETAEYPIEFGDPAVVTQTQTKVDYHSQNFSMCSLLFYLFIGRYPYDGRLLSGYTDDTLQEHYTKFRDYHKMPVFIFDPENKENALGIFFEEEMIIDLWNELPEPMRELFTMTLRQSNAQRTTRVNNPTPSLWLKCFEELGWITENEVEQ